MSAPYVVTDDLSLVYPQLTERKGLALPSASMITEASQATLASLRRIFSHLISISAQEMVDFMEIEIPKAGLPVISLTTAFNTNASVAGTLSFSRTYAISAATGSRSTLRDIGLQTRLDTDPALETQYEGLVSNLDGQKEVALADDVLATGGTALKIASKLEKFGVQVKKILANVVLEEAYERLSKQGIELKADHRFKEIIDEVCLRDFVVGTPDGGRNVIALDGTRATAPYINPFGMTTAWASIKEENAPSFSADMLEISARFWRAADRTNGRMIKNSDLIKPLAYLPKGAPLSQALSNLIQQGKNNVSFAHLA